MELRRQRIPRMVLHGVWLWGVVRRSQAGGLAFSIVATFVLAFLRQTCLTYVCTQILLLPLTRLWSSTCIRALEAPGLYYNACMTYCCCRVVLWYLPVSPWSWSYTFACMISVRSNRGRHTSEPDRCLPSSFALVYFRRCRMWLFLIMFLNM